MHAFAASEDERRAQLVSFVGAEAVDAAMGVEVVTVAMNVEAVDTAVNADARDGDGRGRGGKNAVRVQVRKGGLSGGLEGVRALRA